MDVFHVGGLTPRVWFWAISCFAALGLAVVSIRHSPRWRKTVAAVSIPVFVVVAALGINTEFGLNKTLGSALGISTEDAIQLAKPDPDAPFRRVPCGKAGSPRPTCTRRAKRHPGHSSHRLRFRCQTRGHLFAPLPP